jgi:hypothetical protein
MLARRQAIVKSARSPSGWKVFIGTAPSILPATSRIGRSSRSVESGVRTTSPKNGHHTCSAGR